MELYHGMRAYRESSLISVEMQPTFTYDAGNLPTFNQSVVSNIAGAEQDFISSPEDIFW